MKRQYELRGVDSVFNLHGECAEDPARVLRERQAQAKAQADAEAYALKCQKTFEQCPGFVGCDAPRGPGQVGHVIVEPGLVADAMQYLKRRFVVNQNLELDAGSGLCLQVASRSRPVKGKRTVRVHFTKPVQFELSL